VNSVHNGLFSSLGSLPSVENDRPGGLEMAFIEARPTAELKRCLML
jgi:hypothetical protein